MEIIFFVLFILIVCFIIYGLYKLSEKYRVVAIVGTLSMSIVLFKHAYKTGVHFSHDALAALNGPNALIFAILFIVMFVIIVSVTVASYKSGHSFHLSIGYGLSAMPLVFIVWGIVTFVILKVFDWILPDPKYPWVKWALIPILCLVFIGILILLIKSIMRSKDDEDRIITLNNFYIPHDEK